MKKQAKNVAVKVTCEFLHKYLWILWNLLIVSCIVFFLLSDIFVHCEGWLKIFKDIHDFLDKHILFTGLFSTIFGLIILFWIYKPHLYIRRPQIEQNEGKLYVVTRFFNTGLFKIHSVHVDLQKYRFVNNERITSTIPLVKNEIPVIGGIFAKASDSTYRVWSSDFLNSDKMFDPKWEGIRCRVSATNSFSGLTCVYETEISIQTIKSEYDEKN